MFQDEARFGRMVRIRRCWAQAPERPTVCNGYEREFVYVYAAVSPMQGQLDWMISRQMNTARMNEFLTQLSCAHADEFIVMVVDAVQRSEFACGQGSGGAAEHAVAEAATVRAGAQPSGAHLGRAAREGLPQSRICRPCERSGSA